MLSKRFWLSIITGILALLILLSANAALASADPVTISTSTGTAYRQGRPDIHGNVITWKRLMDGASNWDIFFYDLSNPGEQIVTNDAGMQFNPVTNGTDVIWEDWQTGHPDIWIKNLFSGAPEAPLVTGAGNQGIGAISGNTVVYVDSATGQNDIHAVDFNNPSVIRDIVSPAAAPYDQWQPRIDGARVVWQDNRDGNYDIFLKDLSQPGVPERRLTTDPGDDVAPDISGDIVVWKSHHDGRYDIRWMNVSDGVEKPVTDDAAYQESPAVSGDLVVWMDHRNDPNPNSNYDIYMKDLTSGQESMLAGGPNVQVYPRVYGDKVVWEEYDNAGNYYIKMATVPDLVPPTISGVTPESNAQTGGDSPLISASYKDNRVGIDTTSVHLTVDGTDVTPAATVTGTSVSYHPDPMADGQHSASVTVADLSGNTSTTSWIFYTSQPSLQLSSQRIFWGSYADYQSHQLSVQYRIANQSVYADALGLEVLTSPATSGVLMIDATPIDLGDVLPGAFSEVTVKYLIPQGVSGFKTSLYSSCIDSTGNTHYFPGPPPL